MHFCPKARVDIFSPSCPLKKNVKVPRRYAFPVAEKTNLPILHDSDISEHNILTDFFLSYFKYFEICQESLSLRKLKLGFPIIHSC